MYKSEVRPHVDCKHIKQVKETACEWNEFTSPEPYKGDGKCPLCVSLLTSSRCGVDTMATFYKNCDHRGRWKGDPLDFHRVKVVNRFYDQRKTREEVISLLESLGFEALLD